MAADIAGSASAMLAHASRGDGLPQLRHRTVSLATIRKTLFSSATSPSADRRYWRISEWPMGLVDSYIVSKMSYLSSSSVIAISRDTESIIMFVLDRLILHQLRFSLQKV